MSKIECGRRYRLKHPERLKARRAKYKAENRDKRRRNNSAHNRKYPQKHVARVALYKAVRRGTIIRPDHCERCGFVCKPEGHHSDYSQFLKVNWLCVPCHTAEHLKNPPLREREAGK